MLSLERYIQFLESVLGQEVFPLVPITTKVSFDDGLCVKRFFRPENLSVRTYDTVPVDFDTISSKMIDKFQQDIKGIEQLDRQAYADTLFYLIASYYSRLGVDGDKGFSRFDQIRVDAAALNLSEENKTNPYVLIKGDISGIQDFIYHTSDSSSGQPVEGKNKAKRLRGRSFYISLLTDTIADVVIHRMGLQESNILYSGGGHFSILAPNDPQVISAIEEIRIRINNFFREKFQLRLTLVLESNEAPVEIVDDFSVTYNLLEKKIVKAKKQKALSIFDAFASSFDRSIYRDNENILDNEFRRIGELLTKDCLLIEVFDEGYVNVEEGDGTVLHFEGLGIQWILLNKQTVISKLFGFLSRKRVRIFSLGAPEAFLDPLEILLQSGLNNSAFGLKYFGLFVPRRESDGEILDFNVLAERGTNEDSPLKYPLLSVMRVDIDNLGAIFSFGLEDENRKTSLYHVAALSRELIHFFCHHVNQLAKRHCCYITYSGGDDAFIVGSWVNVLAFAGALHDDFKDFSCGNSALTLSAGILHCNSHYPLQKAGAKAGDLESSAKNHDFGELSQGKDAVNVFGTVVKWDTFKQQLKLADDFLVLFDPKKQHYTRSMLHSVLFQIRDTVCENGAIDLRKLHRASARLAWIFAKKPHKITRSKLDAFDKGQLEHIEKLKVEFAKRLIEEKTADMVKHYSIITSYILLKTRKSRN